MDNVLEGSDSPVKPHIETGIFTRLKENSELELPRRLPLFLGDTVSVANISGLCLKNIRGAMADKEANKGEASEAALDSASLEG